METTVAEGIFVGRQWQLHRLQSFLDRALASRGQVVFVTGEPGAGKTRLVREFTNRALETTPNLIVALGECNAQTGEGDAYLPFKEILGLLMGDVENKLKAGAKTKAPDQIQGFLSRHKSY